jgi:hypothetical protein
MRSAITPFVLASIVVCDANAQAPIVAPVGRASGVVVVVADPGGTPVGLTDVRLTIGGGATRAGQTDAAGRFAFADVGAGAARIELRRMGYRPVVNNVQLRGAAESDSLRFVLEPVAAELTGIAVNEARGRNGALAGFYARKESNLFGRYMDREAIEATHAQRPSETLRSIPGIMLRPSGRIGNLVRIRGCRPTVWVDGVRLAGAELDEVSSVGDIAAIEVYNSLAGMPQQFIDRTNPCGALVLWSRIE